MCNTDLAKFGESAQNNRGSSKRHGDREPPQIRDSEGSFNPSVQHRYESPDLPFRSKSNLKIETASYNDDQKLSHSQYEEEQKLSHSSQRQRHFDS